MKEIKFIPGYYEWHLLIDNQLVWVENDGDIDVLYEDDYMKYFNGQILESDFKSVIDNVVDYIKDEALEEYKRGELNTNFKFTKKMFNTLNLLTDEEWNLVWKAIHDGYASHYGITNRIFKYKDLKVEAVGNILGGCKNRVSKTQNITTDFTSIKIDRKEFYKIAKKNKASCDVYRIIGDYDNFYMLGNNNFIVVEIDKDFKSCDSYSKWYN